MKIKGEEKKVNFGNLENWALLGVQGWIWENRENREHQKFRKNMKKNRHGNFEKRQNWEFKKHRLKGATMDLEKKGKLSNVQKI